MRNEDVANLQTLHLKSEIQSKSRLSGYIENENYQALYLRQLSPKKDDIEFNVVCFLFIDKSVFYFDEKTELFTELADPNSFFTLIKSMFQNNRLLVDNFSLEIENLESSLFERNFAKHFIDFWFDLRNELSKIDRYNSRMVEVIQDFNQSPHAKQHLANGKFHELRSILNFTQSKIKDEISRLDILHHYYLSIKGDKLNKSLFILTVISGLFLPLNLIVGFFGMNTKNLFFENNPSATIYVVAILGSLLFLILFFIPVFRLFDRFLFGYFFGKVSLYKNLNRKFEEISATFKVE